MERKHYFKGWAGKHPEELEAKVKEVMKYSAKDFPPFIEEVAPGSFQISGGEMVIHTGMEGARLALKALRVAAEYRTPTADEFVQGFEFERANDYGYIIAYFSNPTTKVEDISTTRIWTKSKVWWEHPPKEKVTEVFPNGVSVTMEGSTINFFKPFDVQSFIDQGLIRVKI